MRQFLFLLLSLTLACISHENLSAHERDDAIGTPVAAIPAISWPVPRWSDKADCLLARRSERRDPPLPRAAFAAPPDIVDAIERASNFTGVDFEYLLRTAALESSFNQSTEAKTSSAIGLFQFVEHTWLAMVREVGFEVGLDDLAGAIVQTIVGDCDVPDPEERERILRLRYDPELSAIVAGAFARRNAGYLARQLDREPATSELYIAHFLGPTSSVRLIQLLKTDSKSRAKDHFPQAARANRTIFFRDKEPRTIAEVYDLLVGKYRDSPIYAENEGNPATAGAVR